MSLRTSGHTLFLAPPRPPYPARLLVRLVPRGTQLRSAKALLSLVSEFSSTRATALGLPLEFFRVTHTAFNEVGLDQVWLVETTLPQPSSPYHASVALFD